MMKFIPEKFILLLGLLICVSSSETSGQNNLGTSSTPNTSELNKHRIADAVNSLGYKLLIKMMKHNVNQNSVMSPTGIAGLLAMTLLGSVGETYDELARALGFSQDILDNRKNHEELGSLLDSLNVDSNASITSYADAIFVDDDTKIRQSYRNYLNAVYKGDALSVSFNDVAKTKDLINEWVTNNTNGKIVNFLQNPLPMSTRVTLLSALYFKGQWAKPFIPEYTLEMEFKTPSGPVNADLMLNLGSFGYAHSFHEGGLHMISLPYNDSINTMYVLMPVQKHKNLTDLMENIDYSWINQFIERMTMQKTVVRFPKMEIKNSINLEHNLKELGIRAIFSPRDANFALMVEGQNRVSKAEDELVSRINDGDLEEVKGVNDILNSLPNPGVYIDSVLHDVRLTINEFGTEAAAATLGSLARSAHMFYADSPFYMFIRNEKTKLVTFSAVIFDPTKCL